MTRGEVKGLLRAYRDYERECQLVKELTSDKEAQQRELEKLRAIHDGTLSALNDLPYLQKRVLSDKYINGKKWEWIEVNRHISERNARNIANAGLDALAAALSQSEVIHSFLHRHTSKAPRKNVC